MVDLSRASVSRAVLGVIIVVVVVVAAIGAYYAARATRRPVTLTVVTYSGAPAQPLLELAASVFEQEHPGVKVNVVTFPYSQYISNELSVLEAKSPEYDVVTYTTTTVGQVAPYLLPLNSSIINESDILPPDLHAAGFYYNPLTGNTTWVGVPIQTDGIVILYNARYFNNATLQQEFYNEYHVQLSPETWGNWSTVLDVDQFFVSHNITKYGVLLYTDQAGLPANSFMAVFGWYYVRNSSLNCGNPFGMTGFGTMFMGCVPSWWGHGFPPPAINTSAGVQALETLKELVSYMPPPTQLQVTFYNSLPLMLSGQAPAIAGYLGQLPSIANKSNASVVGVAPLPGDSIRIGLTYIGVNRYSQHKQLALEFLQLVESPQFQVEAFLRTFVFPSSRQAYQMIISNTSIPAYLRQWAQAAFAAAGKTAYVAPYFPAITSSVNSQVGEYLLNYIVGATPSAEQALQQAAATLARAIEVYYSGSS
ncbi:ABC transporter substrate-binding protein [Acidilobus sp.]|uniref:ABC transporter substrate-binding protein n=1 Tax=Acidilobus sp. TaxID=1872109 RepID=UPI003CFD6A2F